MGVDVQPVVAKPITAVAAPFTGRRRDIALMVVLLGLLLDLLDVVIVNVALPSVQADIGINSTAIQWMIAAYTLSFAVLLVTSGRLGDIVGRKRMFLIGMAGFTIASLFAGLAQTPGQLIGARFLQGAMSAAMVPQVLALIQAMFPPAERGRAWAGLSMVFAIGTVGGPVVGALLTGANFAGWSWRTIFLVNVPIGIVVFVVALFVVPESKGATVRRLDVPAVFLVTAALLLLIFPLVQGRDQGWPAWTFASIAASLLLFAVLVVHERRRRTDSPLIPVSLFRHRSLTGGLFISLFFMAGVMPFFLINTLYLQIGLGYSVLQAGFIGIIWGFAPPLFTAISSRYITPRIGRLGLQLGLLLLICGMLLIMLAVHTADQVTALHLAPGFVLGGAGMGLVFAPLLTYTLKDVPVDDAGSASGLFNTTQQVGTVLGIAACGVVFFGLLAGYAGGAADGVDAQMRSQAVAAGASAESSDRLSDRFHTCFVEQMRAVDSAQDFAECRTVGATADERRIIEATQSHATRATRADYRDTMRWAPLYQIGLFALALVASFWLPRRV
jgi:EmrB/QacA subfamily drug resistance transporter